MEGTENETGTIHKDQADLRVSVHRDLGFSVRVAGRCLGVEHEQA
ncbi:hypothetical protein GXY_13948 [Novacetimonas hansenii ATCC 23769]|uniref:Uncharacterized protein n=1 Tax=Novacetimonas hansenii ATCC 23769 TaxID=714995 RepID=D5QI09_NOVHA|nr:hypothetical protein GXY_13948 [Novacetimonas hansenii ATCC 23769]